MRLKEHKDLWTKIREFTIDDPDASIKFSDKLAFENNWSGGFTRRAIEEYKRFIFLCCISPTGASPSEIVDEVWHLHLTYTHNYWKEFCKQTLGKEIHHHPSKGGFAEKGKHENWYIETIRLYQEVFGEHPPIDIWPDPEKPGPKLSRHYIPDLNYNQAYAKYIYLLALPFLYPFLIGKLHPFALTGPQFLSFFPLLFASTLIILRIVYLNKKKLIESVVDELYQGDASSFQLARFVYGAGKTKQAAIVDFASKRILNVNALGRLNIYPSNYKTERDNYNPLSPALLQRCEDGQYIQLKEVYAYYDDAITYHQGLSNLYKAIAKKDLYQFLVVLIPILIGVARIIQGNSNDRPVTYLTIMVIASLVISIAILKEISPRRILQNIFTNRYKQNELSYMDRETIPAQFIFLGLSSLAGVYAVSHLSALFKPTAWDTDSSSVYGNSTGCGSSCGGSSCGGGGGCGGCGGGD